MQDDSDAIGSAGDSAERNDVQLTELEQAIWSAREFVRVSDDLRPRTLERARERIRLRTYASRFTVLALVCMAAWSIAVPVAHSLSNYRTRIAAPSAAEIGWSASDLSQDPQYGPDWGMVEAFQRARPMHDQNQRDWNRRERSEHETRAVESSEVSSSALNFFAK